MIDVQISVADDGQTAVLTGTESTDFARVILRLEIEMLHNARLSKDAGKFLGIHLKQIAEYIITATPERL